MRTRDILLDLDGISTFYQYLYMSRDHSITFNNDITNLTLTMDDNLNVFCKNDSFPDIPPHDYTESLTPGVILAIIQRLSTYEPVEVPGSFKSRWDEIKMITATNLVQNRMNWRSKS